MGSTEDRGGDENTCHRRVCSKGPPSRSGSGGVTRPPMPEQETPPGNPTTGDSAVGGQVLCGRSILAIRHESTCTASIGTCYKVKLPKCMACGSTTSAWIAQDSSRIAAKPLVLSVLCTSPASPAMAPIRDKPRCNKPETATDHAVQAEANRKHCQAAFPARSILPASHGESVDTPERPSRVTPVTPCAFASRGYETPMPDSRGLEPRPTVRPRFSRVAEADWARPNRERGRHGDIGGNSGGATK